MCHTVDALLVFGSPVWVARTFTSIPDTYEIGEFFRGEDRQIHRIGPGSEVGSPESDKREAYAIWDGDSWVKNGTFWKGGSRLDLWGPPVPRSEPLVDEFVGFEQKVPDNRSRRIP